jgi:hypothetical protein
VPSDDFKILLRVALELLNRSHATKRYLESVGPGETREHEQLVRTITTAVEGIEGLFSDTLGGVIDTLGSPAADAGLSVLASHLEKFSRWFTTIHELLVYLPRPPVRTETVSALANAFGQVFEQQQPSVILGTLFNALEFDFLEIVRHRLPDLSDVHLQPTRNIVLQLPICDRDAPHAWAILAHELSHAIDLHEGISERVTSLFVTDPKNSAYPIMRSWCRELSADLIAAKALGPAPILALLTLELCLLPLARIFLPTETHPSTRWRLRVVSDFLRQQYDGVDYLVDERDFYEGAAEYSLRRAIPDDRDRLEAQRRDARQFDSLIKPLADKLYEGIAAKHTPRHFMAHASLERCLLRLRGHLPISAQGLPREELRAEIEAFRRLPLSSNEGRAEAFQRLAGKFAEQPLEMPLILLSGFKRRLEILSEAIAVPDSLRQKTSIDTLSGKLSELEQLVASSINTSSVHRHQLGLIKAGEPVRP